MINELIKDICSLLTIPKPNISYDTTKLSGTMLALYSSKDNTIFIKQDTTTQLPDILFAIAHELRHIWQVTYFANDYVQNYQVSNNTNNEDYNNQIAEIDANAFALIVMTDYYNLQPLFNGLTVDTINRIKLRAKEIVENHLF